MKLKIDREQVKQAFALYVRQYNAEDEKIMLKIRHTYRVAEISERIAAGLGLSAYDIDLAWLIGMLHDIGRFEQLRQYGTFVDADSIDHAHFGVELLFRDGLIRDYVDLTETPGEEKNSGLKMGCAEEVRRKLDGFGAEDEKDVKGESDGCNTVIMENVKRLSVAFAGESEEIGKENLDGFDIVGEGDVKRVPVAFAEESEEIEKEDSDGFDIVGEGDGKRVPVISAMGSGRIMDGFSMAFGMEGTEDMGDLDVIRTAIWNHSAYRIEEGLDERTLLYCKIIRDADKVDIFKVAYDTPIEVLYRCTLEEFRKAKVTLEVMQAYQERHAVLRSLKKTPVDFLVGHIALVFELEFPISRHITQKQGYLRKLLSFQSDLPETAMTFEDMRKQMDEFLSESC